jgi:hypothetical protein
MRFAGHAVEVASGIEHQRAVGETAVLGIGGEVMQNRLDPVAATAGRKFEDVAASVLAPGRSG